MVTTECMMLFNNKMLSIVIHASYEGSDPSINWLELVYVYFSPDSF